MQIAKLYMIPCPIISSDSGVDVRHTIAPHVITAIHQLSHFVVERARTARRYIRATDHPSAIDQLSIFELDKRQPDHGLSQYLNIMKDGVSIGVLSEAGCPGIADPGNLAVQWAHENGFQVVPLVGPSSILLALMASGMNGQNFSFIGYLPHKKIDLERQLKKLEIQIQKSNQSQIFIETPYKNSFLLENILKTCHQNLKLCIASDLNSPDEYIMTKTIKKWNQSVLPQLHKKPCIFILG